MKEMNTSLNEMVTDGDRCESGTSNLMDLIMPSTTVNQRMRRIQEILDSIPYFFNSMLDDNNLQRRLLVEPGSPSFSNNETILLKIDLNDILNQSSVFLPTQKASKIIGIFNNITFHAN